MIKKNKIKKDKIQKVVYKTTNVLLTIIVIIAIIYLLTLVIQKIIFKNEMPNIFGFKILQVMSGSMSGTFETGDLILVKKITRLYSKGTGCWHQKKSPPAFPCFQIMKSRPDHRRKIALMNFNFLFSCPENPAQYTEFTVFPYRPHSPFAGKRFVKNQ